MNKPKAIRTGNDSNADGAECARLLSSLDRLSEKIDAHRAETATGFARLIALIREANGHHEASRRRSKRATRRA